MPKNLFHDDWQSLDPLALEVATRGAAFRPSTVILQEIVGGPGQTHVEEAGRNTLFLPLAGETSQLAIKFKGDAIVEITPGEAFNEGRWRQAEAEIQLSLHRSPTKIGRDFSFSNHRVTGSWRGETSQVQILPPPDDAPRTLSSNAGASSTKRPFYRHHT